MIHRMGVTGKILILCCLFDSTEVQRRNKGKYGDSGFARMTTSTAAYSVEKERCERAAGVYFRAV
jgi:hypothetical protein